MSATAKLTGRIIITPALNHEEMNRLAASRYIAVEITDGPGDGMGHVEQRGVAIVPGPVEPLSTGGVARDIKDLIDAFPGHCFEGALVREAAERFGGAKSSVAVLDDGRTVQY